ncbi:hypothetical protein D3C77_543790 [compost metagenome]
MEIPEELAGVIDVQRFSDLLTLDQNLDFAILHDGVVNLLALLRPNVADVLWRHLRRVEDVIA